MDALARLRVFVAVAEAASFARAAAALRISATKASRAVAEVEDELGVTLLRRTTRSVALTDAGARYLEHCRHALSELDDAARSLRGDSGEPAGRLVVSAPTMFGRKLVLPVVAALLEQWPRLAVELLLTDRMTRLAEEGVDVAVRIAELSDSSLTSMRLREVRRVLVASPSYLERRDVPAAIGDLGDHALIAFEPFAPNDEWRFAGPGRQSVRLAPRLRVNDMAAAISAARSGLGVARVFCYQVEDDIGDGRLVTILDEFAPPPVPVSLVFQASRQRSVTVRAFVDLAVERLRRVT